MKEEIIIAGFGGQGVLSMVKILAYSGPVSYTHLYYYLRVKQFIFFYPVPQSYYLYVSTYISYLHLYIPRRLQSTV